MGTATAGAMLPAAMHGTFFSRFPLSHGSRPYYMDGYQVGLVSDMDAVFPFNKAKYPNYRGFPGFLAEAGMVKEGATGAPVYDDDQYVFYIGSSIGVVRAVLEWAVVRDGRKECANYAVIEPFKIPGRSYDFTYEATKFGYAQDDPNTLLGVNGFGDEINQLTLEALYALSGKSWDQGIAYPCIRLGYIGDGKGLGGPDKDGDFHPELIRPEAIYQYLAVKLPDLGYPSNYAYFQAWNEAKGIYNWQDREQFPAEELMEYVFW
jgi:hypothetical protein